MDANKVLNIRYTEIDHRYSVTVDEVPSILLEGLVSRDAAEEAVNKAFNKLWGRAEIHAPKVVHHATVYVEKVK